jgi:hypothetical protein
MLIKNIIVLLIVAGISGGAGLYLHPVFYPPQVLQLACETPNQVLEKHKQVVAGKELRRSTTRIVHDRKGWGF